MPKEDTLSPAKEHIEAPENTEANGLRQQLQSLQQQFDDFASDAHNEMERLRNAVSESETAKASYETDLHRAINDYARLEKELAEEKAKLSEAQSIITALREQIAQPEKARIRAELEQQKKNLEAQIAAL